MKFLKYLFFIIYCFTDDDIFTLDIDTNKNFIMPKTIYARYNDSKYKIENVFVENENKIKVEISPTNVYDIDLNDDDDYYYFLAHNTKSSDIKAACQDYIKEFFSVISSDGYKPNHLLVYNVNKFLNRIDKNNIVFFFFRCQKSVYEEYVRNQRFNLEQEYVRNQRLNLEQDVSFDQGGDFLYKKAITDSSENNIISSLKDLLFDDGQPVKNMIEQFKKVMIDIGSFFVGSDLLKDLIAIGFLVFIMHYIIKALFEDKINTISMYVIGSNLAFALLVNQIFIYFSNRNILENLYILVESLYYNIVTFLLGVTMEGEGVDLYGSLGLYELSNSLFDPQAKRVLIIVVVVLIILLIASFAIMYYIIKSSDNKYSKYLSESDMYSRASDISEDALGWFFILCVTIGVSVVAMDYLIIALVGEDVFTSLNKIFILFAVNISFVFLYIQLYTNIVGIFLAVTLLPLSLSTYLFHIFQDLIKKNIKIIIYMLLYTPICFLIFSIFIDLLETKVEDNDVAMSIITCIVYIMILFNFFYCSRELINSFLISTSSGLQSSLERSTSTAMSSALSYSAGKVNFLAEGQSINNSQQRYLKYKKEQKEKQKKEEKKFGGVVGSGEAQLVRDSYERNDQVKAEAVDSEGFDKNTDIQP